MKRIALVPSLVFLLAGSVQGQSFEVMPGTERLFVDVQWLKQFEDPRWSLFSRSRATDDYQSSTSLFTGGYLNYTSSKGIGGTLVGRISSMGSGLDVGAHFFKGNTKLMIYALASIELSNDMSYSWFSILRYYPQLSKNWKLYSSLELFSNFVSGAHVASVQRVRIGVDRGGFQFGLALNLSGFNENYSQTDENPGIFLRKDF